MNVSELAEAIFFSTPKDPHSIKLGLEDNGMNVKDLFEFLITLFTEGMKILHGDDNGVVNLDALNQDNFDYVNRYFESIGFKCHLEYGSVNQRQYDPKDLYTNINITINTPLQALKLPLISGNKIYVICFELLNNYPN